MIPTAFIKKLSFGLIAGLAAAWLAAAPTTRAAEQQTLEIASKSGVHVFAVDLATAAGVAVLSVFGLATQDRLDVTTAVFCVLLCAPLLLHRRDPRVCFTLVALVAFAQQYLSLSPPWQVECGLAGILGLYVGVSADDIRGPVRKADVTLRRTLKGEDEDAMDKLLLEFFGLLHEAMGSVRPAALHGFPPRRPR